MYRVLHAPADDYLGTVVETSQGALPPNDAEFYQRFGGLL
jgi:hypothetical protein